MQPAAHLVPPTGSPRTSNDDANPFAGLSGSQTTFQISFLEMQKSGRAVRVNFSYVEGLHDYGAVARILKTQCNLVRSLEDIAKKIHNQVEAQKNGLPQTDQQVDSIAIQDDALYLIGRDMSQEVLLKDLRKYAKQLSDLNKVTVEQLEAIIAENNRHEKELERIEKARTEAVHQRQQRLIKAEKEQLEQLEQLEQQMNVQNDESGGSSGGGRNPTSAIVSNVDGSKEDIPVGSKEDET